MAGPVFQIPLPEGMAEQTFEVKDSQTDVYGNMRLPDLARQMEKITEMHLMQYGIGFKSLLEEKKAWVISWSSIQVNRLPKKGETIVLRMWPGKNKAIMYLRNYCFYTLEGRPLVWASSLFVLMDTNTRRAVAPSSKLKQIPVISVEGEAIFPAMHKNMPEFTNCIQRVVLPSEIDKNGHMNNTCYLDWADDIRYAENIGDRMPVSVWIQYNSELKEGQCVDIRYSAENDTLCMQGSCAETLSFLLKMDLIDERGNNK